MKRFKKKMIRLDRKIVCIGMSDDILVSELKLVSSRSHPELL